ncbi:MAG: preprotein translocase subunit SecE [Betaproteobacteria bacterium]|jgi:preprotein translocase subunit SecE|nr:MAG: preprotein translocase subunit SecE [Betaproteobacteria bacterium]
MLDKIKLFLAMLIVAVGISGFYLLAEMPLVVKVGAFIGSLIVAALVAWTSEPGQRFSVYVRESITEVRKVVWPTRKETVQSTAMVLAFVFVMAVFLWGVDWILASLVRMLMGMEA